MCVGSGVGPAAMIRSASARSLANALASRPRANSRSRGKSSGRMNSRGCVLGTRSCCSARVGMGKVVASAGMVKRRGTLQVDFCPFLFTKR